MLLCVKYPKYEKGSRDRSVEARLRLGPEVTPRRGTDAQSTIAMCPQTWF